MPAGGQSTSASVAWWRIWGLVSRARVADGWREGREGENQAPDGTAVRTVKLVILTGFARRVRISIDLHIIITFLFLEVPASRFLPALNYCGFLSLI